MDRQTDRNVYVVYLRTREKEESSLKENTAKERILCV